MDSIAEGAAMVRLCRQFLPLFAGLSFFVVANGLFGTVTPLRAQIEQFSSTQIGIMGSVYYAGFMLSCWKMPLVLRRIGHARAFVLSCVLTALVALAQGLVISPFSWALCRFVTGLASAGIYLIVESWLNDAATNGARGRLMSIYTVVNYAAQAGGQTMTGLAPVGSFTLFAMVVVISIVAAVPLVAVRMGPPKMPERISARWAGLFHVAPVGLTGSFVVGLTNGALWSLGPLFGTGRGLSDHQSAMLMAVLVAAGALSQWPFGRLSDRIDRRLVLIWAILGAVVCGQLLTYLPLSPSLMFIVIAVFGFFFLPIYAMAASCAYDEVGPGQSVEMASAVLLINGAGAVIGPLLASNLMDAFGPSALFGYFAVVHLAFVAFVINRLMVHEIA